MQTSCYATVPLGKQNCPLLDCPLGSAFVTIYPKLAILNIIDFHNSIIDMLLEVEAGSVTCNWRSMLLFALLICYQLFNYTIHISNVTLCYFKCYIMLFFLQNNVTF